MLLLLPLLISLSLSEVLSPKVRITEANLQAWRYFKPSNKAASWLMLPDWVCFPKTTVG